MKIITIANQKGGVGKTTTAFNFASALVQKHNKNVLLVDFDPQGNLSEYLKYYDTTDEETGDGTTIAELLTDFIENNTVSEEAISCAIQRNEKNSTEQHSLDYIPADLRLAGCENNLQGVLSRETVLKRMIESVSTFRYYDYIIIDTLPSLGILMLNAITAADGVIVPTQTQKFSADGLQSLFSLIGQVQSVLNPELKLYGILPTMVDNTGVSRNTSEKFKEEYTDSMFESVIHKSVEAAKSSESGISVIKHKTKIGEDYIKFADEFIRKYE